MVYVFQFSVILLITFLGEVLHAVIPLPVPAGIYGLVILFAALKTRLLPLERIKKAADFMLDAMPVMFVAPCAGFMAICRTQGAAILYISLIAAVTTVIVMGVTGHAAQLAIRLDRRNKHD